MTYAPGGGLVTEARNATLEDLFTILTTQRGRSIDLVTGAENLSVRNGNLIVAADTHDVSGGDDGADITITPAGGEYRPLKAFHRGISGRLGVPHEWLTRMLNGTDTKNIKAGPRLDLYDLTVNGLLHGGTAADGTTYPGYAKRFLVRMFKGDDGQPGLVRALLSAGYKPIDHLDIVAMVLQTVTEMTDRQIREALGLDDGHQLTDGDRKMFAEMYPDGAPGLAGGTDIRNINLTEDTMHLRIYVPGVTGHAPQLAEGYRNPFTGRGALQRADGWTPPFYGGGDGAEVGDLVRAFVDIRNNEVGQGSYKVIPGFELLTCTNGNTAPHYAVTHQHTGAQLEEGIIEWSDETRAAALKTVMLKTRDALLKFLSAGFLDKIVAEYEGRAPVEISAADTQKAVEVVAQTCQFTDKQAGDVLAAYMKGGQFTAGGMANAVTAAAQMQPEPAAQMEMDDQALPALMAAADYAEQAKAAVQQ